MKLIKSLSRLTPDPSKQDGSYQDSLVRVTRAGTIYTTLFFFGFTLVYLIGGYPLLAVWINIGARFFSITAFFLITRFNAHRKAAHLVTLGIYLSSTGVLAISGGIHSSSIVWLIFVPVVASMMAGLRAGLRWGILSLITVIIFYIFEATGTFYLQLFQTTREDMLIDLVGAIVASSIVIWYSDNLKAISFSRLEQAEAQLKHLAAIDTLTNTYNRRYFLEQSNKKLQRIYTSQGYASFLLFDVDHFKKINDTHGHLIGDDILRGVAQICKENLRPDDLLGRFGGEEFVVLLPDTKASHACDIAERLRTRVENTPIETDIGLIRITISIGMAVLEKPYHGNIDQLLLRADQAMYLAKQAGRNQVMLWEEGRI